MRNRILLLILAGCIFAVLLAIAYAQQDNYKIVPEDIVKVSVYEEPDLDTQARVSSSGDITMPLIDKVNIGGLTIAEAQEKITALLQKDYLVNPQVSVFVEQYHPRAVTVIGEVKTPGSHELNREKPITLLEAVAMAGDFTEKADLEKVTVMRVKDGKKVNIPVNINDITKRGDKSKDILIENEDVVFVPESYERKISIMGEVNKPGNYEYSKDNPITVTEAIALAEWFTEEADLKGIKIIRKYGEEKDVIPVDINAVLEKGDKSKDIPLEPYDIVFIPRMFERKFSVMGEVSKPGTYELNKKKATRVSEAIATAGGFTDKAKQNGTNIIRMKNGKKEIIRVKITDITKKGMKDEDVVIEPDDIIFVPESFW